MIPFTRRLLPALICLNSISAWAAPAPITLTGDYIQIGTSHYGTIGSIGNTSPGILYDNSGTSTFNTSYDYLTPGSPFEGFFVRSTSSGSTYNATAKNNGGLGSGLSYSTFTDTSSGSTNSVRWEGSYDPGSGKLFDITNDISFADSDKIIKVTTTITAATDLSDIYFLRAMDPDAQAAPGDSSSTTNVRGNGSVSANNLVYAEALASKYVIGYYSSATSGVNTGISSSWSQDPTLYYSGNNDGNGDYTIGIAFYNANLSTSESLVLEYYYIFGSDISAAVQAVSNLSVLGSSRALHNSPSYGAARTIDNNPELLAIFTNAGLSGDQAISSAASQTLPLFTGSSTTTISNALGGINRIIQARIAANRGMSSGDDFVMDKNFWLKPFTSWTTQDDKNGVSGFNANTHGIAAGFDSVIDADYRLGVALAYAKANTDSKSNTAPNHLKTDVYQLVGYGSYNIDELTELNFQVDFGRNQNQGERTIAFTSTVANSSYQSLSAHAGLGIAKSIPLNDNNTFTPSIRADYTWIKDDAYHETGAGALNLNVNERTTTELLVGVDGKFTHKTSDAMTLSANLGVAYDLHNGDASITSAFAGAPTASFVTYGIRPEAWRANAGLGAMYKTPNGLEVKGRYDVEYRNSFLNQTASVKLRWQF